MTRARLVPLPPRRMLVSGSRAGLEEVAVTTRLLAGVSTSFTMNAIVAETVSSGMVWPGMGEMVGGSFTGVTVRTKLVLTEPKLVSVTEIVMVALPDWLAMGVSVMVRLAPLPPKRMLLVGTNTGFEEAAARIKRVAGVTESPMVKAMGPTTVSSLTVRLAMLEMVGTALAEACKLTTNR